MYKVQVRELSKEQKEYILSLPKKWQLFHIFFGFTHPFSQFVVYKHIIDTMYKTNQWVDLRIRVVQSALPTLTEAVIIKALKVFRERNEIVRLRVREPNTTWWIGLPDVKTLYDNTMKVVPFYKPSKLLLDFLDEISEKANEVIENSDIFFLERLEEGLEDGED